MTKITNIEKLLPSVLRSTRVVKLSESRLTKRNVSHAFKTNLSRILNA